MSTSPYFAKAFLGTNGRPAASGWFFAYAAGSTVPKPIYSDRNNTVPLANPLRLDGNGICPQFFTEAGLYDFQVFEYNFVTPDAPGPSCFTAEDIDGETGGGGSTYVLPIATETVLGGVKPDGATTFVDEDGVLTAPAGAPYELPTATTVTLGGVKPDGATVQVDPGGVLSVILLPPGDINRTVGVDKDGGVIDISAPTFRAATDSTAETDNHVIFSGAASQYETLPDPASFPNRVLHFTNTASDYWTLYGSFKVDGKDVLSIELSQGDSIDVQSIGSAWWVIWYNQELGPFLGVKIVNVTTTILVTDPPTLDVRTAGVTISLPFFERANKKRWIANNATTGPPADITISNSGTRLPSPITLKRGCIMPFVFFGGIWYPLANI